MCRYWKGLKCNIQETPGNLKNKNKFLEDNIIPGLDSDGMVLSPQECEELNANIEVLDNFHEHPQDKDAKQPRSATFFLRKASWESWVLLFREMNKIL